MFKGKTVMVTGAGKNIGKEIALSFAKNGANLIICDYNKDFAERTVKEVIQAGAEAFPAICDVRNRAQIFEYVETAVKKFGKIDILINNAGGSAALINKLTRFIDAEESTLNFVIDTNIKGAFNCTQAVLKSMIKEQSGKIINISSIAAICGLYDRVDYSAAKAALIGMTKSLAMEVGEYNICVNCVSPGAINRNREKLFYMTYMGKDGHGGTPKDISDIVLFLASQDFITGQNFVVDGGRTLGPRYDGKALSMKGTD